MKLRRKQKGVVLAMCMIFLCIFATLAFGLVVASGVNAQIARNQHKADGARACAESGLEITRCWLNRVSIPGTTPVNQRFALIAASFQSTAAAMSNTAVSYDSSNITVPTITLNSTNGQDFSAVIIPLDSETLQISSTGRFDSTNQTIRANYKFGQRGHTVFNYGVATKGPLSLQGNVEFGGVNISVESNVYIESNESSLALSLTGNSKIAGNVSIANPAASVYLSGSAGIGGETGQAAIDNHVSIGVEPTEFPTPDPDYFRQLVSLTAIDPATYSSQTIFENIIIPPNTNPSFASDTTFRGIVLIETPNQVSFTGNVNITGIIVGDGDVADDSKTNQITFSGNVQSYDVSQLPQDAKFDPLRDKIGTFLMAPGFAASFGGNFQTLNGAIAANGVEFFGNAGGTINGSIVNYSQEQMSFSGNSDLYFNRSGTSTSPPGFVPEIILEYDSTSYSEGPF